VTFTPVNWNAPQTVTVTGLDDAVADGNQVYSIVTAPAASTDPAYNGLNAPDVSVTNIDNDSAGVSVNSYQWLTTTEAGGTADLHHSLELTTDGERHHRARQQQHQGGDGSALRASPSPR